VNWAPLTLAVVFGVFGITMMLRHRAPRTAAVLAALALLCLLAGIPSFLAALGHPLKPGLTLLIVVAAFCVSLIFFYLDVIRGEHKSPVFKGKGGAAAGAAGGGGGKHNHHLRPLLACVGLAMASLLLVFNFAAVEQSLGGGFSQTFATYVHHHQS
jgi:energy-coupling factor transporter transmembrane protein EcfT